MKNVVFYMDIMALNFSSTVSYKFSLASFLT